MDDVKRDYFVFYRSFKEGMEELSDADKLMMYEAISDYSLDGKEPVLTGFPKALFRVMQPILDANTNRWKNGKKGGKYGTMGGAPKGNKNACKSDTCNKTTPNQPQNNPKTTPNKESKSKGKGKIENNEREIENNSCVVTSVTRKGESVRFTKPTIQEIESFIKSESITGVDATQFFNYYEANGWKVGRNPMKNWKAAVRTWQRNNTRPNQSGYDTGIILKDNSIEKFKDTELW